MKPRSRARHKGRRDSGSFTAIPHAVQDSANWKLCSGSAIKLLLDVARQYNGRNNGDMCATFSVMKRRGWKSCDTLARALKEVRHYGFLLLTRQGGLDFPSLYALTWHAIDPCDGKLTCASQTTTPPGDWKQPRPPFPVSRRKNANTESGEDGYGIRNDEGRRAA